ncbi:MAG TPA: crosslink repair DNA glycosylase YcaQ family protein [Ignavibacteria bacterium]|nr:crosslink repair DNA glycosylase YcaQ family protein [Ignavibacteria bacterium]
MSVNIISKKEARAIIISSQKLSGQFGLKSKDRLLKIIESIGYVQIDTISVVERSHHHILWTRLPGYKKQMLDDLLETDKSIFEYWSHAAAYLPMKYYRYSLIRKNNYSRRNKDWEKSNKKILKFVYDRISSEGPLQSKDFEDKKSKSTGWWDWKPSKNALDFLFHKGELMIKARKGFQKVYDLTERVLPDNVDTSIPSESEFYEHLILSSVNSNGFASIREITYSRRFDRIKFAMTLNRMLEEKSIQRINISGLPDEYFTTGEILNISGKLKSKVVHILSPFDNLIIQRKRLKDIFDFDYTIECYVPEAKRIFGYFIMPVLYGDKFIARIDAKADRANDTFVIKNIFPEGKPVSRNALSGKLKSLSEFCGCNNISGLTQFLKK